MPKKQRPKRTKPSPKAPCVTFLDPGTDQPRFQDWSHDPGMRRQSSGSWAARFIEAPERAKGPLRVDKSVLLRELLEAVLEEAMEKEKTQ
jgi:hypothetical protein